MNALSHIEAAQAARWNDTPAVQALLATIQKLNAITDDLRAGGIAFDPAVREVRHEIGRIEGATRAVGMANGYTYSLAPTGGLTRLIWDHLDVARRDWCRTVVALEGLNPDSVAGGERYFELRDEDSSVPSIEAAWAEARGQ